MQTTFKVCKLFLLLCFGVTINAIPIIQGLKTTSYDQQAEHSFSSNPSYNNAESNLNLQPFQSAHQSLKYQPGATTFRDQNGNIVTQLKKETFNNENGQNSQTFEFQESKQHPNGYSKSFKKEYSSSSVIGPQHNIFIQKPENTAAYYNSEKLTDAFGQYNQNYQEPSKTTYGSSDYSSVKSNLESLAHQNMANVPGVTSTFRDQYGNIVTQVKKETINNDNGQNSRGFEFEETKQLPNGYSKSFKKEYSSSSMIGSQPNTFIQKPVNTAAYYNSEKPTDGESSAFGKNVQNYQVPSKTTYGSSDYSSVKSNLESLAHQNMANVPGVTSTFRDQNGNIVTQVKKESINNDNGQNSHVVEFEETKQLPNGYSKSFKKEYSSSSVIGSQPNTFSQKPVNTVAYYNSEKLTDGESSAFGQNIQNYQVPLKTSYGSSDYSSVKSNLKSLTDQNMSNVPGVTSTFRDQNGNIVTQVKKETINNDNGQNSRVVEFEETKQLPNGYSKSFKKEYSSSSVIGSQPNTFSQKPVNTVAYYNSEKLTDGESSAFGQNIQNYQVPLKTSYGSSDYSSVKSNLKSLTDQNMSNVPGVTSTFRDQNGNIVTQVKKETINNDNGQNSRVVEFEETKQLPNGYSKSFKKEYSSSSVIGSQPNTFSQKPVNTVAYYNSEKLTDGESSAFGQNIQNYQVPLKTSYGSSDYSSVKSNLKSLTDQNMANVPGVTSTFRDQNGNIVTQVKKEAINNDNGQNSRAIEFEETKQLPNGYSKSFKKEYSSSNAYSTLIKDSTTESNTFLPQTFNNGESEKFNGYNTFFNNQKYALDRNGPINSQIINNKQTTQTLNNNKADSNGYKTKDQVDCDESVSSQNQGLNQPIRNIYTIISPSPVSQQSVNIEYPLTPKTPISKKFEKIESFSTQKHEETGQQSVDLDEISKPSPKGQESVNIDFLATPRTPYSKKFEKIESFSTQKHEETGQQSVDLDEISKPSPKGQESVNIDFLATPRTPNRQKFEKIESFSPQKHEETGQQSVDLDEISKPSPKGQESVNIDFLATPRTPNRQKFEKIESFSTQKHEETGQQSVDLDEISKPSPKGQESVNIDFLATPRTPNRQKFEKIESFSPQKHEETGQQSVDLDEISKPSPKGQESVNIDFLATPRTPNRQKFEKIESFSTQKHEETGQQSVDLDEISKPSPKGQESVNIDFLATPRTPNRQKFEKIESFSTQKHEETGQQSVDLDEISKPSPKGQESVNIDFLATPRTPYSKKFEKIESFSTQKHEETGQQSVDLDEISKPSPKGQESVNIDFLATPRTPYSKKFEKIESFSTQKHEETGQQSVDLDDFSRPSPTGQESVNIDFLATPRTPNRQKFEKIESFSTQKHEETGQQSVDLDDFSRPSPTGQESVNIDFLATPRTPNRQKFEKIESFSTQKHEETGQQSVDLDDFSRPSPTGQESVNIDYNLYTPKTPIRQFEKIESSYQNKYKSAGQQPVVNVEKSKSSQQIISHGQQTHGLELSPSTYSGTNLLDLRVLEQQSTTDQQNKNHVKPSGQQTLFDGHNILDKNIELSSSDHLSPYANNYQTNINTNHRTLHGQPTKSQVFQGQQSVDLTSISEEHQPTYQAQHYGNVDFKHSTSSSNSGKHSSIDQPINPKFNNVFDKLGELEHEILEAKSTVNINKDNYQTSYSTNHNVKSMPVQTSQQVSHFSKNTNDGKQYREPESEIISNTNGQTFVSSSFVKESKTLVSQDNIENQTFNNEHLDEDTTTQSSFWQKMGDKFKGSIQSAKNKAKQLASTINDSVKC